MERPQDIFGNLLTDYRNVTMTWEGYAWITWLAAFGVLETIGLTKHSGMTLTYFVEHYVPKFVIAALLGWMYYHFLIEPLAKR